MKKRIVIAGGGFAGLYAARYLDKTIARRANVEVLLICRENFVLFTPLLHEVAAGDLYPSDIVNPLRRILRHVRVIEAEVEGIDLGTRKVRCRAGVGNVQHEFEFDHLLFALGAQTNFFGVEGAQDWAVTMKTLTDAALLRNRMVALLEQATVETDEAVRQKLLTFVTAGGGFAGVETTGAVNDFMREATKYYPSVQQQMIRVVIVHPGSFLLPELGKEFGRYAERKLCERKVEIMKGLRVVNYDGSIVRLSDGTSLPAATLIWTAGVKPPEIITSLPLEKDRGRLRVNDYLAIPEATGLWAAGDCAAVPDCRAGESYPPTAQHASREGVAAAKNIERAILGLPLEPFRYTSLGLLASIGHRTGVAIVFGIKFSGFIAWCFWRTLYLLKLPGLPKKLRVVVTWTIDIFFGREIEQMITREDVEVLSGRLAQIRKHVTQP
jgi:NADH dehydrogenase